MTRTFSAVTLIAALTFAMGCQDHLAAPDDPQAVKVAVVSRPLDPPWWTQPSEWLAGAAVLLSLVGVGFSGWQGWQIAVRSRSETFRMLRQRFNEVRTNMKTKNIDWANLVDWNGIGPPELTLLQSYWVNAFDEWYITKKRPFHTVKRLWHDYYAPVLRESANSPGLMVALFAAFQNCHTKTDQDFVSLMWKFARPDTKVRVLEMVDEWNSKIGATQKDATFVRFPAAVLTKPVPGMKPAQKRDTVLRVLRGESLDVVAKSAQVDPSVLDDWRRAFITAGTKAL